MKEHLCTICFKRQKYVFHFEKAFHGEDTGKNSEKNYNIKTYWDCFQFCTQIRIPLENLNSPYICMECIRELQICYKFLQKVKLVEKCFEQNLCHDESNGVILDCSQNIQVEVLENLFDADVNLIKESKCKIIKEEQVSEKMSGENVQLEDEVEVRKQKLEEEIEQGDETQKEIMEEFQEKESQDKGSDDEESEKETQETESQDEQIKEAETEGESTEMIIKQNGKVNASIQNLELVFTENVDLEELLSDTNSTNAFTSSDKEQGDIELVLPEEDYGYFAEVTVKANSESEPEEPRERYYLCEICARTFDRLRAYNSHMRVHKNSKKEEDLLEDDLSDLEKDRICLYVCDFCGRKFEKPRAYKSHLRSHKSDGKRSTTCPICKKTMATLYSLKCHMIRHKPNRETYKCDQCDKVYHTMNSLNFHKRIHSNEVCYDCADCGKKFYRPIDYTIHRRFHTKDFPFICEVCGKRYAIKGHLKVHMWKHQNLKVKCDECGKLFSSNKALNDHLAFHTNKLFKCYICNRNYPSKPKYKAHLKNSHDLDLKASDETLAKLPIKTGPLQRKTLTLVKLNDLEEKE